ncbi:glycosyl hydrolase family 18 protein [Bacillus sp. EB01]|uniref:glycosyl hydrolase family 18 protein n=1 Tax=Bacillus sp. EB01 TaxID=1347086 RepID=UPI0005C53306|nr:glycoside hydrolase family 18 protein [Bacillus sp. EB01]
MKLSRKLAFTLIILIIFAGGFLVGSIVTSYKASPDPSYTNNPASGSLKALPGKVVPKAEKAVIGYVQDFRDPKNINYKEYTHVIFSFAHPSADGKVIMNGDLAWDNLRKTVKLAREENTKVMLAVGGWYHLSGGASYRYFKQAISQEPSRTRLVNELLAIVNKEQLDGIDIDFEHPRSEEDARNLTAFAKELKLRLDPLNKELSVAVYSKINAATGKEVNSVVFKPELFLYTDRIHIMAYDGQWDDGYHAANLAPYDYVETIVHYWSSYFDRLRLSKEKLVLGIPAYAQPEDQNAKQLSYAAIVKKDPRNAQTDSITVNGTTYFYNGEPTVAKKAELAFKNGFGGMMLWEAGHDSSGDTSLAGTINDVIKQDGLVTKN